MKTIIEYLQTAHSQAQKKDAADYKEEFKELMNKYSGTKLGPFSALTYFSYAECKPEQIKQNNNFDMIDIPIYDVLYHHLERTDLYMIVFNYTFFMTQNFSLAGKERDKAIKKVAEELHDNGFVTCAVDLYGGIKESNEPLVVFNSIEELATILKIIEKAL